jgi:hypothetical protein
MHNKIMLRFYLTRPEWVSSRKKATTRSAGKDALKEVLMCY